MTEQRSAFLLRLFSEMAIIVAGVLIALAVDAWWENKKDKTLEKEALVSLSEELAEVSERIANLRDRDTLIIDQVAEFIRTPAGEVDRSSTQNIKGLFSSVPYELRLKTYDELLNTGRLNLISDRRLRLLLTDFDARAKSVLGYENQLITQWNETARPALYKIVSWNPIFEVNDDSPRQTSPIATADLSDSESLELQNIIIDRANFVTIHRALITSLDQLVLEIQDLTDSQLSE